MNLKTLLGAALLIAVATPALSQEFYIVRGADKKCVVIDKKPESTTTVTVIGNTVYKTRTEAESAVKTVCTN
jgi:hypothetical protein